MATLPRKKRPTLCGKPLEGLLHVCAFVDSRDQQYEILLPYLREGMNCEERLLNIVAPENRADHVERLSEGGIDADELVADGRLTLLTFEDSYLKDGCFCADRVLGMIEEALAGAKRDGFPALRAFGEMHWALSGLPGTEQLIEYETRVNYLAPQFEAPLVCVYDVAKFSGRVVMDILSTHPKVILGGQIFENPYYMETDVFLKYLADRKTIRAHARHQSEPPHIPPSPRPFSPGTHP
jgi:hypothetical protein